MANLVLRLIDLPLDNVPSSAKRFSFFLGILLNTVLFTLHFGYNNSFKRGPTLALIIFSGLESIGGFCVGCWFFKTFFVLRNRSGTHSSLCTQEFLISSPRSAVITLPVCVF